MALSCSLWETLPCDWEVRGHCMCKEMPVIPVNKVVDPKRIIGNRKKWRAKEEDRYKGSLTQKKLPSGLQRSGLRLFSGRVHDRHYSRSAHFRGGHVVHRWLRRNSRCLYYQKLQIFVITNILSNNDLSNDVLSKTTKIIFCLTMFGLKAFLSNVVWSNNVVSNDVFV
jgi:hypothetical protein